MSLKPYDYECLALGHVLAFGKDAAHVLLPALDASKFVYDNGGKIQPGYHRRLWEAIEQCYLIKGIAPTITDVYSNLADASEEDRLYLISLQERLSGYYRIYEPDRMRMEEYMVMVDRSGVLYWTMARAASISAPLLNQENFEQKVLEVLDVDTWVNENLSTFQKAVRPEQSGLVHISVAAQEARERAEMAARGEQVVLLPCGLPVLAEHGLLPAGKLVVLHGLSSSGKSALLQTLLLGTALGLVRYGLKGCVVHFSMEMTQIELVWRMASMLSGFDTSRIQRGPKELSGEDFKRFLEWIDVVGKLPIFVDPTTGLLTSALRFKTEGLHVSGKGPVRLFGADYLELFGDTAGDNKEQRLDGMIHELYRITNQLGPTGLIISQTTYGSSTKLWPAGPLGLRYSRAIGNAADITMEVWNPMYMRSAGIDYARIEGISEEQPTIFVEKYRGGPTGQFVLGWNPQATQFYDSEFNRGMAQITLFDHLQEIGQLQESLGVNIPAPQDTSVGDF